MDIRFHVDSAEWIPEWVRQRLCQLVNTFISKIACVLYGLESAHCFVQILLTWHQLHLISVTSSYMQLLSAQIYRSNQMLALK